MLEADVTEFTPDWLSKPADSLLSLARRRDIPIEVIAASLKGGMETLRQLVKGTQAIDYSLAHSLSEALGGSPAFWLKRQENFARAVDRALQDSVDEMEDWLERVPAPSERPRGRMSEAEKREELRERLIFYGVGSLRAWDARYGHMLHETQFRTSQAFSSIAGSVALWLRQGELEAAVSTTKRWNPEKLQTLTSDVLRLSRISRPDRFLPKLKAMAAEAGVAIVTIRAPKGCRASGASRLVAPDKALVLLSFRHLSDDHFWFTLLHEFAHLLLHGAKLFVDTDDTDLNDKEREANDFASSCIIPPEYWEKFANLRYDYKSVLRLSTSLRIAPGLIVGQLQHRDMIPRDRLNSLKRRWSSDEIEAALN